MPSLVVLARSHPSPTLAIELYNCLILYFIIKLGLLINIVPGERPLLMHLRAEGPLDLRQAAADLFLHARQRRLGFLSIYPEILHQDQPAVKHETPEERCDKAGV